MRRVDAGPTIGFAIAGLAYSYRKSSLSYKWRKNQFSLCKWQSSLKTEYIHVETEDKLGELNEGIDYHVLFSGTGLSECYLVNLPFSIRNSSKWQVSSLIMILLHKRKQPFTEWWTTWAEFFLQSQLDRYRPHLLKVLRKTAAKNKPINVMNLWWKYELECRKNLQQSLVNLRRTER